VAASRTVPFRLALLVGAGALAILAAACDGDTASTGTTVAVETATLPASMPTIKPGAPTALVLRPGAIGDINFGVTKAETVARLIAVLGPPAEQAKGTDSVCPNNTYARWPTPGVSVWFEQDGGLVGWSARQSAAGATPEGIAVGSDVAALRRAYGARLRMGESSLGHSFNVVGPSDESPTIVGLVDKPSDDGKVESLWSGFTCTAH
jgi:hypothetical protein